jgi:MFS family permease
MELLGFATAASGFGYVVGAAVGGPLVDRFPRRTHTIIALAVLLEAASTMLIPLSGELRDESGAVIMPHPVI